MHADPPRDHFQRVGGDHRLRPERVHRDFVPELGMEPQAHEAHAHLGEGVAQVRSPPPRVEARRGRERENVRCLGVEQMRQAFLRAEKLPRALTCIIRSKRLIGVSERAFEPDGARVVDEDVDPAETLNGRGHGVLDVLFVAGCRSGSAAPPRQPPRPPWPPRGSCPEAWDWARRSWRRSPPARAATRAAAKAMARPMPREAPVMKRTFPLSSAISLPNPRDRANQSAECNSDKAACRWRTKAVAARRAGEQTPLDRRQSFSQVTALVLEQMHANPRARASAESARAAAPPGRAESRRAPANRRRAPASWAPWRGRCGSRPSDASRSAGGERPGSSRAASARASCIGSPKRYSRTRRSRSQANSRGSGKSRERSGVLASRLSKARASGLSHQRTPETSRTTTSPRSSRSSRISPNASRLRMWGRTSGGRDAPSACSRACRSTRLGPSAVVGFSIPLKTRQKLGDPPQAGDGIFAFEQLLPLLELERQQLREAHADPAGLRRDRRAKNSRRQHRCARSSARAERRAGRTPAARRGASRANGSTSPISKPLSPDPQAEDPETSLTPTGDTEEAIGQGVEIDDPSLRVPTRAGIAGRPASRPARMRHAPKGRPSRVHSRTNWKIARLEDAPDAACRRERGPCAVETAGARRRSLGQSNPPHPPASPVRDGESSRCGAPPKDPFDMKHTASREAIAGDRLDQTLDLRMDAQAFAETRRQHLAPPRHARGNEQLDPVGQGERLREALRGARPCASSCCAARGRAEASCLAPSARGAPSRVLAIAVG